MPHAENGTNGQKAIQVNGDPPASQFLSHLTSYPVVSDSINMYKSNPYGAKTIDLTQQLLQTYNNSVNPRIAPLLRTPYSLVAPYLARADSLGDSGLTNLENRFPIVREPTQDLRSKLVDTAVWPFALANQSKDYVLGTYNEECQKASDKPDGLVKKAQAVLRTEIRLTAEVLTFVRSMLQQRKKEANAAIKEKVSEKN